MWRPLAAAPEEQIPASRCSGEEQAALEGGQGRHKRVASTKLRGGSSSGSGGSAASSVEQSDALEPLQFHQHQHQISSGGDSLRPNSRSPSIFRVLAQAGGSRDSCAAAAGGVPIPPAAGNGRFDGGLPQLQPQHLPPPPAQDVAALLQSLDQGLLLRTQIAGPAQQQGQQEHGQPYQLPSGDDDAAAAAAAAEIEATLHEFMAPDDLDLLLQLDPEDLADALLLGECSQQSWAGWCAGRLACWLPGWLGGGVRH